jgi:hypothetical protein
MAAAGCLAEAYRLDVKSLGLDVDTLGGDVDQVGTN